MNQFADLIPIIGTHLLKSETCCVGHVYALALVSFNNSSCVEFLNMYLDYYLTHPELYFDQEYVLNAVVYLDKVNQTNYLASHTDKLENFKIARQKLSGDNFNRIMELIGDKVKLPESLKHSFTETNSRFTDYYDIQIDVLTRLRN